MSLDTHHDRGHTPRLWIVEALVVIGVIAFGYLAMSQGTGPHWSGVPAEIQSAD
jgi:hypothetical protein